MLKTSDKVKVARVLGRMLGVADVEKMTPDQAVNSGLRSLRGKRMTPEFMRTLHNMVKLAVEVGIKVDKRLVKESAVRVNKSTTNNFAKGILSYRDFVKLLRTSRGEDPSEPGHTLAGPDDVDQSRHRKAKYKSEIVAEEDTEDDPSEEELEDLANDVEDEEDILDAYDDEELRIIDADTGDDVDLDSEDEIKEQALLEVLSRAERMRARIRFLRTKHKRMRRMKIVLNRRSDKATINKRARRLAVKMLKKKYLKKAASEMTVAEKERAERLIASKRKAVDRLAMRLVPKIRRIESDRLSHTPKEK